MERDELLELISGLGKPTVLVVGDLILDRYLFGRVDRISPEAPVPVLDYERDDFILGGAANVAHNIAALGGNSVVAGVMGCDAQADEFERLLAEAGIATDGVVRDPARPTTVKTRVIGGNQQLVRVDRESRAALDESIEAGLGDFLRRVAPGVSAIVVSDYGKGVITTGVLDLLRELRSRHGFPVIVDPKDTHFSNYRSFTVVTPNLNEASLGAGFRIKDRGTLLDAGEKLLDELDCEAILVTRGSDGMSLFRREADVLDIPTRARDVYDVTGAGDTVVSMLALALASGLDLPSAAHLANWAAGVVVAKHGTATATRRELADYINRFASRSS